MTHRLRKIDPPRRDAIEERIAMGNDDQAHISLARNLDQAMPDLRLRDGIEHRRYLITDQISRIRTQRAHETKTHELAP